MTVTSTQIIPLPNSYLTGCGLSFNGNKSLNLGIGQARDNTNSFDIPITSPIIIDSTSRGVNGLDIGSLQQSRFYYVFIINSSLSSKTPASILSLSSTSPTLPEGYDLLRLIGVWNTDLSSNFRNLYQLGIGNIRTYFYDDISTTPIVTGGNSIVFQRINFSNIVPTINNTTATIFTDFLPGNIGDILFVRIAGSVSGGVFFQNGTSVNAGERQNNTFEIPILLNLSTPALEYRVENVVDNVNLSISGFTISL